MGVPFQRGDEINLISRSSTAVRFSLFANIRRESGKVDSYRTRVHSTSADRSQVATAGGLLGAPGTIEGFIIERNGSDVTFPKRGQTFVIMQLNRRGSPVQNLATDYWSDTSAVALGQFNEAGPGGGNGFLSWVEVFHDRAGNAAAVDFALSATNAIRKVLGLAWYYNSSGDVADRTFVQPQLLGLGGAKPTGFILGGSNAFFWNPGGDIALIADQEGAFVSYADTALGRSVQVDTGVAAVVNTSVDPTPWPLWVTEDDVDTIIRFPAITSGEAADRHSAYVLVEEWIEV